LAGVWARGASQTIWDPYFFAAIEAGNLKFGMQLVFGEYVT